MLSLRTPKAKCTPCVRPGVRVCTRRMRRNDLEQEQDEEGVVTKYDIKRGSFNRTDGAFTITMNPLANPGFGKGIYSVFVEHVCPQKACNNTCLICPICPTCPTCPADTIATKMMTFTTSPEYYDVM